MRRFTILSAVLLVLSALGAALAPPAMADNTGGGPVFASSSPSDGDSIQNDPTGDPGPVVTVTFQDNNTLDPSSTITVEDDTGSALSGTTTLSSDKLTLTWTPETDLTEAGSPYEVTYHAVRETLILLHTEGTFDFSVDNTAPAAPSITSVEGDATSPASGNDTTPTIVVGGVAAGETVTIFDGETEKGSLTASGTSVTFNADDDDTDISLTGQGAHPLTATTTDAAGNESPASTAFTYNLDTVAPAAPTISSVNGDNTTPASGKDATPPIVVTGVVSGDSVRIYEGTTLRGSKTAAGTSVTFNAADTDGDVTLSGQGAHTLTAKAADPLGNESTGSTGFVYNLDTVAPTAPSITSVVDDNTSPAQGDDPTPKIVVGSVTAGDKVWIYDNGVEKGFLMAASTSVTFNADAEDAEVIVSGNSDHPLTAKAEDSVGNISSASATFVYTLDNSGVAPVLVSTSPVDDFAGAAPSTASATYNEPLKNTSTLTVKNKNNNNVAGTVTFSGDGKTIIFTPSSAFTENGSPYTATASAIDHENKAATPTVWNFTVDTTAPTAPVIASINEDTTSPASGSDTTPPIRVTGVSAGDTVAIVHNTTVKGTKVVPNGATEVIFNAGPSDTDVTLSGTSTLKARATDAAGNVSPDSATFDYTVDTTAPTAPTISSVEDDTTTPATGADPTPKVVVTGMTSGDTVKLFDGASEVASKAATGGTVTFNAAEGDTELTLTGDGAHVLKAKAVDPAGNISADSASYTYNLDTTGPALASTSPADGSTVTPPSTVSATYGEALDTATSTITVKKTGGATVAGATSFASGNTKIVFTPSAALTQADSPFAVTVTAKDALGNTTNSAFSFAVDTTAPAAPTISSIEGDTSSPASGEDTTPTIVVSGVTSGDTVKIFEGGTEKGSKVASATTVTFNAIESAAEVTVSGAGNHSLTAKAIDPAGNASASSAAFVYTLIVPITPTVTSVDPASAPRDTQGVAWLSGSNFTEDAVVTFSGGGITVDDQLLESAGSLGVLITIDPSAALGARDVTVSIPNGGSATCVGCFTVLPAQGYTLVGADGGVFNFGTSTPQGSMGGKPLNAPVIGIAHTPTGDGYWLVAEDGGIFSFGDAKFHGSMGGKPLNAPVLGMEPTPTGGGYWLFAADGGIFSFGDAVFHGSMGGRPLNAPVVGMAATGSGAGYWLVAEDGGIFSFGDADFHGSTGSMQLAEPVFDMAALPDGSGYWLVARDGGIFAFDAPFHGSAVEFEPFTVVGMGATSDGNGYWIADEGGFVYEFGNAAFLGDLSEIEINAPIVGFAVVPAAAG